METNFQMNDNPMNEVQQVETKLLDDWRKHSYYIYILHGGLESRFYDVVLSIMTIRKS